MAPDNAPDFYGDWGVPPKAAPSGPPASPKPSPSPGVIPPSPGAPQAPPPKPAATGIVGMIQGAVSGAAKQFTDMVGDPTNLGDQAHRAVDRGLATVAMTLRAPGQLIGGTLDTAADVGTFIDNNIHSGLVRGALYTMAPGMAAVPVAQAARKLNGGASLADTLSFRSTLGQVGGAGYNQAVTNLAASIIPLAVAPEGAIAKAAGAAAGGAVGMDAPGGLQDRAVNAALGAGTELGISAVGAFVSKAARIGRAPTTISRATPEEGLADNLDRGFATARTQDAKAQAAAASPDGAMPEPPPQEVVPPSRHTDPAPPTKGSKAAPPADQPPTAVTDANAALTKSGAAEQLPTDGTHEITSDGRAVVDPATKATVDNTPMGRAFAARDESDAGHILFKEEDEEGGRRIVYRPTPEDLQGFLDATQHYSEHPEDIDIRRGSEAASRVGEWKLSTLNSADDVPAIGRAYADQMQGMDRPVTDAEWQADAARLGEQPVVLAKLASDFMGDGQPATLKGLTAVRTMAAKADEEVASLLGKDFRGLDPDHPDFQDARRVYHNGLVWAQNLQMAKADVSRSMRALGQPLKANATDAIDAISRVVGGQGKDFEPRSIPDFDTFNKNFGKVPPEKLDPIEPGFEPPMPRTPEEFQDAIDRLNVARQFGPDALGAAWQGKFVPPNAWKYLFRTTPANWFTAAIVSAPSTLMRDLIGPAILGGLRTVERTGGGYAAALKEATIGDASKVPGLLASASSAPQAYLRTVGDMLDSLKAGYDVALKDGPRLGQNPNPVDFNAHGVPPALIQAAASAGNTGQAFAYSLGNLINKFPQAVHALHGGVNETALRMSFMGEVRAGAMVDAAQQGLDKDAAQALLKERLFGARDPIMADDAGNTTPYGTAHNSALRNTYTQRVGADTQPIVQSLANLVQTMRAEVPETRYILPIFTVPANAIGETLRRVPALNLLFAETRAELTGAMGPLRQAEAYGRTLSGAALLTGGFVAARNNILTGGGPLNAADRGVWLANGFQPYSIKLGNTWVSYNRLDVAGAMLGIVAGAYDQTVHQEEDNPNHIYAAIASMAQYMKDQSALKGLSDALSFGGSPEEGQGYLRRLVDDTTRGFVPNFITQIARNNADHVARVVRNPWEAIQNALPFFSQNLDPQRNLLGEDVMKPQGAAFNMLPVTLSNQNVSKADPELAEMDRLMTKTGYAPGVISPGLSAHGGDMRDIKLEDGHSMYDALQRYRGTVKNDDGMTLREALHDLTSSEEYKQAADGTAHDDPLESGSKVVMLQKTFNEFTKLARQGVASDSDVAARYMVAARLKAGDSGVLGSQSVHDLATPSGFALMKSLGIHPDEAMQKVTGQ